MAESRKIIWQTVGSSAVGLRREIIEQDICRCQQCTMKCTTVYNEKKLRVDHHNPSGEKKKPVFRPRTC